MVGCHLQLILWPFVLFRHTQLHTQGAYAYAHTPHTQHTHTQHMCTTTHTQGCSLAAHAQRAACGGRGGGPFLSVLGSYGAHTVCTGAHMGCPEVLPLLCVCVCVDLCACDSACVHCCVHLTLYWSSHGADSFFTCVCIRVCMCACVYVCLCLRLTACVPHYMPRPCSWCKFNMYKTLECTTFAVLCHISIS